MKLIYPKEIDLSNICIKEKKTKFAIYNNYGISISGIIILLDNITLIKEYNKYRIILPSNNPLKYYDDYLSENITDYKKKIINKGDIQYIIFSYNELIDTYYQSKKKKMNIYIRYVKKMGFFNIPIISIL